MFQITLWWKVSKQQTINRGPSCEWNGISRDTEGAEEGTGKTGNRKQGRLQTSGYRHQRGSASPGFYFWPLRCSHSDNLSVLVGKGTLCFMAEPMLEQHAPCLPASILTIGRSDGFQEKANPQCWCRELSSARCLLLIGSCCCLWRGGRRTHLSAYALPSTMGSKYKRLPSFIILSKKITLRLPC